MPTKPKSSPIPAPRGLCDGWTAGTDRGAREPVTVPGLFGDPRRPTPGTLWYARRVTLPVGEWTHADLVLKGARFCPSVWVNGSKVSSQPGGMAPTLHPLNHPGIGPGRHVDLEIELLSLDEVPCDDASRTPDADRWRSNVSSGLWDEVVLRLRGPVRIARCIPCYDHRASRFEVRWSLDGAARTQDLSAEWTIRDSAQNLLHRENVQLGSTFGKWSCEVPDHWPRWCPEDPARLTLHFAVKTGRVLSDSVTRRIGLRDFRVVGTGFLLNGEPVQTRSGTVVWHRWLRDPEARELAFDTEWFRTNVVGLLKAHGANGLRFHLGTPPERLLDLCDEAGLLVQAEWLFFHGIQASSASMQEQWRHWLDMVLAHPSVVLVHPWNETEDPEETSRALDAIARIEPDFPPFVLSHRDVIHAHRYWWSLFEDIGLDYDTVETFGKPVVADEFGGNYLDGDAQPGAYPTVRSSLLRFLGPNHTAADRLTLHRDANSRIAEYWRRLGAAGFSPFCILGSPEDGNHHYMGDLRDATPKPVWDALTAAYSPVSCSIELWDRNFLPGGTLEANLYLFNDTSCAQELLCLVQIEDLGSSRPTGREIPVRVRLQPHSRRIERFSLRLPERETDCLVSAVLVEPIAATEYPVVSFWAIRTLKPTAPRGLTGSRVFVPGAEPELVSLLQRHGIAQAQRVEDATVVAVGGRFWSHPDANPATNALLDASLRRGVPVVMLDAGPREDQHQRPDARAADPTLQQRRPPSDPQTRTVSLCRGVHIRFTEAVEGESAIHPSGDGSNPLWEHIPADSTRIWNGRRGGLIVPAWDMEVAGLSAEAFLSLWTTRGAPADGIRNGPCFAYELDGEYAFAASPSQEAVVQLRERVRFLMDDAPALAMRLNPAGAVREIDLAAAYRRCPPTGATAFTPLACAGKGLTRTPVIRIQFGPGEGALVLSQLYTAGRLTPGISTQGLYGVRHDPAAEQFVLNLLGG